MDSPFNISTSSLGSLKDTSLVQNKMTKLQRAKRLRRQTGTLDISYATDYPGWNIFVHCSFEEND